MLWRRTVDQVVTASMALYEAAPPAEFLPVWQDHAACGNAEVDGLRNAVLQAHGERAEIEAAIQRIKSGRLGQCERCPG